MILQYIKQTYYVLQLMEAEMIQIDKHTGTK